MIQKECKYWIPGHSIDCVVLGFENNILKVLLLKMRHSEKWSLPGGFIKKKEDLDAAALRALSDRTGLKSIYLSQFHTFGAYERRGKSEVDRLMHEIGQLNKTVAQWLSNRFLTTGYFAFADVQKARPVPDFISEKAEWVAIDELPTLIFDHLEIINKALQHIKLKLNYLPIGDALLPPKFTMAMLQKLYETILGRALDRANFQKKMLKLGIFDRLEKLKTGAANKAPYLYSFHRKKYERVLKEGIGYL